MFTGEASAIAACQRRVIHMKKTLRNKVNLRIPPSIFQFYYGI